MRYYAMILKISVYCIAIFCGVFSHANVMPVPAHLQQTQISSIPVDHPKIALVLGSGGARGYAHIGVIKVLEDYGIKPDMIIGVSAGSIVGALYASGKSPAELKNIAMNFKPSDVRDFTLSKQGFFDGQKIEDFINKNINQKTLEEMPIPLYVVATELQSGKQTIFYQGNTGQAVRASTSIPSMFVPTKIGDTEYVDGGLVSPVPVEVAKKLGADIIIAVDILARPEYTETTNVWGLFNQNINVMQNRLAAYESQQADILIQPDIREKQHVFSTKSRQQSITAGENSARQKINQIRAVIAQKQQSYITRQSSPLNEMNGNIQ
ncbi:patatin-like phospholipase family protein [Acinetobacter qingfengensis]|uniref:Alpha/beta hydrolase n=1 Tax=Acinetobacter qingfengensis TaxID=1262585 RepID=A0A1E7REE3_9GAMM|nr:patatin-like phospholipase family protein [Acinetobacter qingfengensis]KAA8734369.1 patatin-like phospholipase family protein [Acinetobacter qingfengensis]OEY97622.1 alpha/beta hydrolase [Acinetobacter qingfengensis]